MFRTVLVHFGGISGDFGRAMVCILAMVCIQNTHGETKRACYTAEVYQNDTIRYLPYPNFCEFPLSDKFSSVNVYQSVLIAVDMFL